MNITLNDVASEIEEGATLQSLVVALALKGPAAAQVNDEIIPHQKFAETVIHEGDRIDIFLMMGGG
jgi:thiamine biosynthesis protein ThiS